MKNKNQCPKCSSTDIIKVPGKSGKWNNAAIFVGVMKHVLVTRYVCAACGFSEEWIDDREDIESIKARFTKL